MRLRQLFENLNRTGEGKAAVVGWGRGMGHKGHMFLASSVITQANDQGADPYFVVSRTVGKDDPITPEEKLAIYKKVFPKHGHIFHTATDEMPDLTRVLMKLSEHGYTDVTVVVGSDQVKALSYVKNYNGKPDKAGNIPYSFNSLNVIARQDTSDPSAGEEGPRATPMRSVLTDPSKSEEEQFAVWRDAMNPEVSDDEVRELMAKAKQRMANPKFGKKVAEGDVVQFPKKHKGDISNMHSCPKCGGDLQGGKYMGHQVQVCMPCKQVYLPPNSGIDHNGNKIEEGFDKEEFRRHMRDLEAREALRKTDPVSAKALDLRGQLPQASKKKQDDDSIGINDPRHPGWSYTEIGSHHHATDEGVSDAMANVAKRLTDPNDGKTTKLRAAGDKRREEHLKSRDIAKKNEDVNSVKYANKVLREMRAKEFIAEAKPKESQIPSHMNDASQGAIISRDIGGYDRIYHLNRIMMAAGMADGKSNKPVDMDASSWVEKYNVAFPYTDAEHAMMMQAFATVPTDSKELSKRGKSEEPKDTNTVSAVAKPKRNKYGI